MQDQYGPLSPNERAAAADRLRQALVTCEQDIPDVLARERAFVCRNLAESIAILSGDGTGTCVSCGAWFSYDVASFTGRGLAVPRRCYPCRTARREARC